MAGTYITPAPDWPGLPVYRMNPLPAGLVPAWAAPHPGAPLSPWQQVAEPMWPNPARRRRRARRRTRRNPLALLLGIRKRIKKGWNPQQLALAILSSAEAGHAFSATCPSHFTIKSFALKGDWGTVDENVANLRSGYLPAIGYGLILGSAASVLTKSWLPFLFTLGTQAYMVWSYEVALPRNIRLPGFNGHTGRISAASQVGAVMASEDYSGTF